uniref:14-3-3 domain-containing protein n=1 Tax=Knipowitschia caucasica TaxID=637954 RepID=A0AAV2M1H4_KNICA
MLAQVTWSTIPSWEESYKLRLVLNNAVIPRLQAWRAIADIEGKSEDEKDKNLALNHLKKIGNEITELCGSLLDSIYSLLRSERDPEAIVFYSTMGGDFCRYMREAQYLEASHPLRLTLVLHLSDFYYEDVHLRAEVIDMAQDAVIEASKLLEKAPNQESSVIVQQFKDRLSLWTPL